MSVTTKIKPGEEFLGIGIVGPLKISSTGEFVVKAGRELVVESVKAILGTKAALKTLNNFVASERFFRGSFGNTGYQLRHENIDDNLVALSEAIYVEAIVLWEPRVTITNVTSKVDEVAQSLETQIEMQLVGTNDVANLVIIRNSRGQVTFRSF